MTEENLENSKTGRRFSTFFYNRITYIGVVIALVFFIIECFLFALDFLGAYTNEYLGMFAYLILPPFLLFGLVLIPVGAFWKRRMVMKGIDTPERSLIHIDPAIPSHRNAILVFICGTSVVLLMSAVGSYKAFHYTESVQFCGTLCHEVMRPEYAAYKTSSHAKVSCVACHIGSGADWYVRAKLSGLRQVYRTALKMYPRPIPAPVHNLRPAKETCEQCHWPGKFFSAFEFNRTYFPNSEEVEDPAWRLRMLVHVGRSEKEDYGIHSHVYVDHDIFYVPEDEKRQEISWVKSVTEDGVETVFNSPDSKYKDENPPAELIRKMDCMDCHNRPSHQFRTPIDTVNRAMRVGAIDRNIPAIKNKALEMLSAEYSSHEEAVSAIRSRLEEYYRAEHKEFSLNNWDKIQRGIEEIIKLYSSNFFPEMNARWDAYPDNIGHMNTPGCFRCHGGEHQSSEGRIIPRDCAVCHQIIEQGPESDLEKSVDGLEFRHPFDEDETWQDLNCNECHTGGEY